MKKCLLILVLCLMVISLVKAGQLYGVIKDGNNPVGKGVKVTITTIPDTTGNFAKICSTYTNQDGVYRLFVRDEGDFLLKVSDEKKYKDLIAPYQIRSYRTSNRYNLIIVKDEEGTLKLRRE